LLKPKPRAGGERRIDVVLPFFLWTAFGAFIGWLASLVVTAKGRPGLGLVLASNMIAGTVGAGLGGFVFNRTVAANIVTVGSVLTALSGAAILLAITNLFLGSRLSEGGTYRPLSRR
jgi:uncharacterized membrane protein YeaQ/YmgE (transglycosylase-associated protein family)